MELPINRPKNKIVSNTQHGPMRQFSKCGKFNYFPSTLNEEEEIEGKNYNVCPQKIEGKIEKVKIDKTENFIQAGERYKSLSEKDKKHLIDNIVFELWHVDEKV